MPFFSPYWNGYLASWRNWEINAKSSLLEKCWNQLGKGGALCHKNYANALCISTLQRQNAENLKQIFPEKEYRGLRPNFHIHVSMSELYIPTMGLPVLLEEICRQILGIYKSLKDT
jgi:hypothetical protein